MKTNKLLLIAFTISVFSLFVLSCANNDATSNVNNETQFTLGANISRDFTGKIVDSNNNPISGANVTIAGQSILTNAVGNFEINNVSVPKNFAYFTVNKAGFIKGSRAVVTHDGINDIKVMMLPATVTATIASGQTTDVVLANTSKITFDGSFMTENGTAYNGNVNVIVNHLDAADPNVFVKMPGNLLGTRTNGVISGMETYGMLNVELVGSNNQKLQIASGHQANIDLPIAPNQYDDAPATIPLWHFNDNSGLWEEQGFSTRVGNRYVSSVSHFSWWNNDTAYTVGTLNVLVKNYDTTPVRGVRITLTRPAGSTGDVLMDLGVTGENGTLSSPVPLNQILIFRAYTINGVLINEQTIPASSQMVRNITIIIPIQNRSANIKS